MKILVFLEKSCIRGGIEIFAERQVAALRAANNEVTVSDEIKDGFDQIIVHKCSDIDTLEKFPPEKTVYYVHDHEPICPRGYAYTPFGHNCSRPGGIWPCLCCAPLCKRAKAAVARVLTQGRRKRAMARFCRIVVISEFMKSRLVANGIPVDHISVEPPEISFKACDEGATGVPQSDLLFVGQLIRGKGVHLLLKAMSIMKTQRTLDIVGTGNMEGELKAMAKRLGLDGRVRFRGFQPNPQDWMRCAECIVVPSFWQEPYGLVAAEAASLGRKVVAFAIGGLPEAGQGKAILVPPGDVKALADALECRGGPAGCGKVRAFVFVDALGWKQVEKYGFLNDILPNRRSIEMQFGYSCTAIPTILTGERPDAHGHLAFYDWAPEKSPFKAMRFLAMFMRPAGFWRRGRVRNVLSRLVKRIYGFTGYFQLYGVPFERLPKLDYCEKTDMFVPGGLHPIKNLADAWGAQGLRYHISNWRLSEAENFRIAEDLFRRGAVDRAFVYSAAFDAMQHDNVGCDDVLRPKVEEYAQTIRALHKALADSGRPFELTVFSDHGMTPLRGTMNAPAALDATGLKWGVDYASAIDSTMARFWWLKPESEAKVREAFKAFAGHWLTEEESKRHGIYRADHKFGDAIFLADPGLQFCPSDMGIKPLNGMHGFDPADEDSLACWLSTEPVPDEVRRVCDYFREMTSRR